MQIRNSSKTKHPWCNTVGTSCSVYVERVTLYSVIYTRNLQIQIQIPSPAAAASAV